MDSPVFGGPPKATLIRQQVTDAIRDAIVQMRLMPAIAWSSVS